MSKVETKEDLLLFMKKHEACEEATEWVKSRKEKTFLEIWNACPHGFWLLWLMNKQDEELACQWWRYAYVKVPLPRPVLGEDFMAALRRNEEARLKFVKRAYRG